MKALQSKLASELLADSTAREQLREFLVNKHANAVAGKPATGRIEIRRGSSAGKVFQVSVVPRTAKSA